MRRDIIASWTGDFADTEAYRALAPPAKEYAQEILPAFLERACAVRDVDPADIEQSDLRPALLEGPGRLELPESVRTVTPDLCAAFLGELERQGRLSDGHGLGLYVRALRGAWDELSSPKPIRNPGARIGRNDPCPCGSGKKYKKCCQRESLT